MRLPMALQSGRSPPLCDARRRESVVRLRSTALLGESKFLNDLPRHICWQLARLSTTCRQISTATGQATRPNPADRVLAHVSQTTIDGVRAAAALVEKDPAAVAYLQAIASSQYVQQVLARQ